MDRPNPIAVAACPKPVEGAHFGPDEGAWREPVEASRLTSLGLLFLTLAALLIQGGIFVQKSWIWTGDTIYHRALMAEILNGELLPGGPYAGLPAFYSPLYHYLAAGLAALFRFDPLDGVKLLSILAAPCTPLVAFYMARALGFDRRVALVGAFFATFGGGLKLTEDRVWVDALFTGQHNFFPLFPRDTAFLLLPLGVAWTYRGLFDAPMAGRRWPILAGLAFGLMILVHAQTAVFAALIVGLFLLPLAVLRPDLLGRALRNGLVASAIGLLLSAFWWVWELAALVQSGSFGVHMPASRVPVKINPLELPIELGVFLPLGLLGVALMARRLGRDRDPAALLLLVWWAVPLMLAIFQPAEFPGGDTFFPRRLWQFASQPLALMAAYGLLAGLLRPLRAPRAAGATALLGVCLLAGVPGSWGTWKRIGEFWNTTSFADTEWHLEGNFRYGSWLAQQGRADGPRTVMAPTPDATMIWYFAGQKVVYLYPTAAIKLAFDVRRLTGFGTDEREADLITAYSGDPERLAELARKYNASYVVLRKLPSASSGQASSTISGQAPSTSSGQAPSTSSGQVLLGAVDLSALGLRGGRSNPKLIETNHYELLPLGEGDNTRFQFFSPADGTATVALRARRRSASGRIAGQLYVNGGEFPISEREAPRDEYAEITRAVPVVAGANDVRFQAATAFELARFVGYTVPIGAYFDRFRLAYEDDYTVVLTPL